MGYYEDHINAVAGRWQNKYKESGVPFPKFADYMKRTLTAYGWNDQEADCMIEKVRKAVQ